MRNLFLLLKRVCFNTVGSRQCIALLKLVANSDCPESRRKNSPLEILGSSWRLNNLKGTRSPNRTYNFTDSLDTSETYVFTSVPDRHVLLSSGHADVGVAATALQYIFHCFRLTGKNRILLVPVPFSQNRTQVFACQKAMPARMALMAFVAEYFFLE